MYRLEQWKIITSDDGYTAPELQRKTLAGRVFDNPNFEDGTKIFTSRPVKVEGKIVTTMSGSQYLLGELDPKYAKWVKENYPQFDPDNPLKI